eukprot:209321-Chlamydomonas_euryale.AAC.9
MTRDPAERAEACTSGTGYGVRMDAKKEGRACSVFVCASSRFGVTFVSSSSRVVPSLGQALTHI